MVTPGESLSNEGDHTAPPLLLCPPPCPLLLSPPPLLARKWRFLAPTIALLGGSVGLVGAFIEETLHGGFFGPFIAGPMIEEALKPSGVYLLLARWPRVLHSRLYTAFLAALGGMMFGVLENLIYLDIYFPKHSAGLVLFRYTAGLALHSGCSFIVGFGINRKLIDSVNGNVPFLSVNKLYFIIPMIIHGLYNLAAVLFFAKILK